VHRQKCSGILRAVSTALFLFTVDVAGAAILGLFGISLPVVQFARGFVLAPKGWSLLNQEDVVHKSDISSSTTDFRSLGERVFYPFTFPVTGTGLPCSHAE
jgi:multiple antibiotic resistance protein